MTVLQLEGVARSYGGVAAVRGVDLAIRAGEVHALLGANGAGKSTLVKMLAGVERPDAGSLVLDGRPQVFSSSLDATARGISLVSQELNLFPQLDVLDNLFLPRQPQRKATVDRRAMRRLAEPVLDKLGLSIDTSMPLERLTLAQQQLIEIARALLARPRLLILDEPNSALQSAATARLMRIVRALTDDGVAVLYVSHLLEEVFSLADVVTVLRDGRTVAQEVPIAQTTIPEVVRLMLGPDVPRPSIESAARQSAATSALVVERLAAAPELRDASFVARPGEVVGLAGLEGSGAQAVLDVLFGLRRAGSGTVRLPGGGPLPADPGAAVRSGVALVPADRKRHGVMLDKSIADNVSQVSRTALHGGGWLLRRRALDHRAEARIAQLSIKSSGPGCGVGTLSGGNQQKVVLAKWLEADPSLVLLHDPSRGVDLGAKAEMHAVIRQLAQSGKVVVLASSDLDELAGVSDRLIVFYRGAVTAEVTHRGRLAPSDLLEAMNLGRLPPGRGEAGIGSADTPAVASASRGHRRRAATDTATNQATGAI